MVTNSRVRPQSAQPAFRRRAAPSKSENVPRKPFSEDLPQKNNSPPLPRSSSGTAKLSKRPTTAPPKERGRLRLEEAIDRNEDPQHFQPPPLSPMMVYENATTRNVLLLLDREGSTRQRRSLSPPKAGERKALDDFDSIIKAQVQENLKDMTRTLKSAVRQHNDFSARMTNDEIDTNGTEHNTGKNKNARKRVRPKR